ncbi:MAG: hypothetical protein GTO51_06775 [Candidatus Latescibacteria bacterium]|nr:hypothetical protein [Candidatus Latescibacterota bacterium]NIM21507.1 hypothetical protein [Candidatus Latescibacterota bacterium]NIM65678.1 hypothetical protein [Candidatus Latescibacterota bacterium]NIO02060.1 hypothetical protein [Candidatus Latescibacterota bacterium]NIO28872.1 hypothetical protein [Candidatus Latescibacterota bacterium]
MRKISKENKKNEAGLSITEYIRTLWRKKYFILVPVIASGIVTFIGVRFLVPEYESSSVILMQSSEFLSDDVAKYVQQDRSRQRRHDRETLALIRAELNSSEFLDEVIRALRMDENQAIIQSASLRHQQYPHMAITEIVHRQLWDMLRGKIDVRDVGPAMFMISSSDSDPNDCYNLTKVVTDLFIKEQEKKQLRGYQEASEFSDEQLALYKEQLQKSERELSRTKTALAQQKFSVNPVSDANIRDAEALLRQTNMLIAEQQKTTDKIRHNAINIVGFVPSSERIWADQQLSELENKLVNMREAELIDELARAEEPTRAAAGYNARIREAENEIQVYLSDLLRPLYPNLKAEHRSLLVEYFLQIAVLQSIKEKYNRLNSFIVSFRKNLELIPQLENDISRIEKEVESNRELYNSFLRAKTSAQISEAVESMKLGFSIEVIEQAIEPLFPERPNKWKIMIISLMFGGILGFVSLVLTEYSNTSFKRVDEIERMLELRVLGVIPTFEKKSIWKTALSKNSIIWCSIILFAMIIAVSGFYFYGKNTKGNTLNMTSTQTEIK